MAKPREAIPAHQCKECGELVKLDDYDWKDGNLYYSLRKIGLCEECARGMKHHG